MIHAVHSNNMSEMGGLRKPMPHHVLDVPDRLARAGRHRPARGLLVQGRDPRGRGPERTTWLFVVLLVGALLTAFYTGALVFMTFFGEYRGHGHPHESPVAMTGPLVLLAAAHGRRRLPGLVVQLGAPFCDWVFFERIPRRSASCRGSPRSRRWWRSAGSFLAYTLYAPARGSATRAPGSARLHAARAPLLHRRPLHEGHRATRSATGCPPASTGPTSTSSTAS